MPANFQPAQPFSSAAYAAAGAGPIIDRQIEFQQQQQVAAQNRNQQAAIAALQAQTALNENSNNNDAAKIRQQFDLNASQRAQAAQFDQQRQMKYLDMQEQDRQNLSRMAMWDQQVSHQEMQQMAQQQAGLVEIQKQLNDKTLTPEEAAPAIIQLKSGINFTKMRLENQQAQKMQSAIAMQHQQLAEMQKADVMSQQFQLDMANKGITIAPFMDPHTGKMHPLAYDPLTKRLYNPFLDRNVKDTGAGVGGEWANLGTNGFPDSKKILSDANSFTEKELGPMPKDPGEKQNEWLDLRKRRFDGIVREFNSARAAQINPQSQPAQPPMQAQQQAAQPPAPQAEQQRTPEQQKKLEQTVQAIMQMPIPAQKKSELLKVNSEIDDLMQIPKDKMTFEQRQRFFMLYDRLKTLNGG